MSSSVLKATRRTSVIAGYVFLYVALWIGLTLLFAAAGIRFFWGEITVGQMLLNLVSVETDGGGGPIVWIGVIGVGIIPLLITAAIALGHYLRKRKRRLSDETPPRRASTLRRTVSTVLVAAVVVGGTTAFASTVNIGAYLEAANSEYDVADHHVEPTITSAADKRNLVLIYLESGEETLANDELFEKDAFTALKDVTTEADGWQSIDSFQQYAGGGWTMSGLVGTQCGVPLRPAAGSAGSSSSTGTDGDGESYLGGVTCLGDVLAEQDYTSVFLGGANSSFAGKDTFLRTHGYAEVKGLAAWRAAGEPEENFRSDWGLSDERLLAQARIQLDELHADSEQTGNPFNLSVLTLDTHEPVHVYDYCTVDTQDVVTSVFACSMARVAEFVDYMEEQGYLEDTAVVIMGDHLKHMSAGDAFHDQLDDHPNRTIFNRIWVPGTDGTDPLRADVDQLNLFPTILEAAGLTVEGRQAGLGVSAFASRVPEGSAQALEPGPYADLLTSLSPEFYGEAWIR